MIQVKVYECVNCQKKVVQQKWICPRCHSAEFQAKKVNGEGRVYSHTTIHVSSKEFEHLTPYTVALVELVGGLRITGQLQDQVEINEKVICISDTDHTYKFKKVKT